MENEQKQTFLKKNWGKSLIIFGLLIFSVVVILTIIYAFYSVFVSFFPDIRGKPIPQSLVEIKNFYLKVYVIRFLSTLPLFIIQGALTLFVLKSLISFRKALIITIVLLLLPSGYFAHFYFSRFKHYTQTWENLVSYVEYPNTQAKISGTFGCSIDTPGQRKIEFVTKDNFETVKKFYEGRILPGYQIIESNLTIYDYDPSKISMQPNQEIPGARITYQLPLGNKSFGPSYGVDIVPEDSNTRIVAGSSECDSYNIKPDFSQAVPYTPTPKDPTANWATLNSKEWGFSLKYPTLKFKLTKLTTQTSPAIFKVQTDDFKFDESTQTVISGIQIYISVSRIDKTQTVDEYLSRNLTQEMWTPIDIKLDGVAAKRFFSHFDKNGESSNEVVAIRNNKVYWLIARSETLSSAMTDEVFNRILSTFRFLD